MRILFTLAIFSTLFVCNAQTSGTIQHKVEPSQTLYAISRLYQVSPHALMKLNPQYGPSYMLKPGNILVVPSSSGNGSTVNTIQAPAPTPKQATNNTFASTLNVKTEKQSSSHQEKFAKLSTHIVRAGETIESIADEEQVTAGELIALNKTKIAHLKPGDVIFVKEYWLPIEAKASVETINKEDAILSSITKEKYNNELLFMNENR